MSDNNNSLQTTQSLAQKGKKRIPNRNQSKKEEEKIKEQSIEEKVMKLQISGVESIQLSRVFQLLCGKKQQEIQDSQQIELQQQQTQQKNDVQLNEDSQLYFQAEDLQRILNKLDFQTSKQEIDLMIWEVDEDLDKKVDWNEFQLMYKKCIFDNTGLEPRRLFTLVEFLMFDKNERNFITSEDTLELLYVKSSQYKKTDLKEELNTLFPDDQKELLQAGEEKKLKFTKYYEIMMKKALDDHKKRQQEKLQTRRYLKENE